MLIGEIAILGSSLMWALGGVLLTRINHRVNLLTSGAARCLSASVFFWILLFAIGGGWQSFAIVTTEDLLRLFISLSMVLGLGDTLFFLSAKKIGMVRAMPLAMTFPLLTFVLAAIFLDEHISVLVGLGAAAILAGVYFLSANERAATPATKINVGGVLLALATSFFWAVGTVILTPASQHLGPILGNSIRQLGAGVLFLIVMPKVTAWRELRALSGRELVMLLVAGAAGYGFGSYLYMFALMRVGASITAVLSATSPLFSTPLSILLLGEKASRRVLIGTAFIMAGVWLVILG